MVWLIFRNRYGLRPSVDKESPDLLINVYVNNDECVISVDTSGHSLHKRGYRVANHIAPLNEVLAAGIIKLSDWKMDCDFIDPMCGSGTILIEAGMMSSNIPQDITEKTLDLCTGRPISQQCLKELRKVQMLKLRNLNIKLLVVIGQKNHCKQRCQI